MIETKQITLGDSVYTVTQMPARRALRVQAKLMKMIGPAFAQTLTASKLENPDDHLPKIVAHLVEQLDENTFDTFILELVEHSVRKDGKEINAQSFDLIFAGKLNELFLLLKFILEVNFSDFFQDGSILREMLPQEHEN